MLGLAVVGPGLAGRARLRAIDEHPEVRLAGVVGRDTELNLAAVLSDPDVDAVLVCTPNLLHEAQVGDALAAGKHVAVEFPLARGGAAGRRLFSAAAGAGRVLHVAHIELLSASQRAQRERASVLGRPRGGELSFSGDDAGWIGDASRAGSPALRAVARLHRLVDLWGDATLRAASLDSRREGYRLDIDLEFAAGGHTRLAEVRAPGLARETRWSVECEQGVLDDPAPSTRTGLFRHDLDCLVDRIVRGATPYVADERVLHVLDLVGDVDRACA